jgi:hypothetical protein
MVKLVYNGKVGSPWKSGFTMVRLVYHGKVGLPWIHGKAGLPWIHGKAFQLLPFLCSLIYISAPARPTTSGIKALVVGTLASKLQSSVTCRLCSVQINFVGFSCKLLPA